MDKLDKPIVLYFPAKQVGSNEGTHCGICMMFVKDHCTTVDGKIDGEKGTCGLYVFGKHVGPDGHGTIPQAVAGYITNAPTHCGNCKEYRGDAAKGSCEIVDGVVAFLGCCNAWVRDEKQNSARDGSTLLRASRGAAQAD